jgi:hypothetical protein
MLVAVTEVRHNPWAGFIPTTIIHQRSPFKAPRASDPIINQARKWNPVVARSILSV